MSRMRIMECNSMEKLRQACLAYHSQLAYVGEVLVDESKWHIKPEQAVEMIRDYLVKHQHDAEDILRKGDSNE